MLGPRESRARTRARCEENVDRLWLNLLLVADVAGDARIQGQAAAFPAQDRQTEAGHQGGQADRLQRQRLAAGVGSGDHQEIEVLAETHVDRHHPFQLALPLLLDQQRMAGSAQDQSGARIYLRHARTVGAAKGAPDHGQLEPAQTLGRALQVPLAVENGARQIEQDALDLTRDIQLELSQTVAVLDHLARLDEGGLAALGAVVQDARHASRLSRLDRQNPAAATALQAEIRQVRAHAIRCEHASESLLDAPRQVA